MNHGEQKQASNAVSAERDSLLISTGLAMVKDAIVGLDAEGRITEFSRSAERLTGWRREQALGQSYEIVLRLSGVDGLAVAGSIPRCLSDSSAQDRAKEYQLLDRNGHRLRVRMSCCPLLDQGQIRGALLMLEDVTDQMLLARELAYHRENDPVTGLLNRSEFEHRLSNALVDARAQGASHVLGYLDVDQFKVINDVLGHQAGDEMLRRLAILFGALLKADDVLARIGGDEFGILLKNTDVEAADRVIQTLLECARGFRYLSGSQSYSMTVSIGASRITPETESVARALADADLACYEAKDAGRDRARWFAAGSDNILRRHGEMNMVGRIGKALDHDQFLLHYEDVVAVTDPGRVIYRELLVRMLDDDGQLVQPSIFIAAAERYYLMAALDRWVMEAAFKGVARLPDDGVLYAINVSGTSLSDDEFLVQVISSLQSSGVDPRRICFEVTETAAISQLTQAVRFINSLADLGCRFALDDFGAGMASFSYLKNLPVQFVKIDGSFVRGMLDSAVDRGLVEAINRIGHEMGLCTIAEHVEDLRALEMLAQIGVDWVQGHAIAVSRPFEDLLRSAGV